MEREAERWMRMLNDRLEEAVQTLERKRVAVEVVFRESGDDGDWLVWVMIQGEGGGSVADSPFEVDREHAAFAARCTAPAGPEAEPERLLLPAPVRDAVLRWALPER